MIVLTTERLVIRDHLESDLEDMHVLLSDAKAMYYLPEIKTDTLEESLENLNTAITEAGLTSRKRYFFAIRTRDDAYVGEIGFTVEVSAPAGKIANLGYFILPAFWGKGIVTEAAQEVLRFGFKEVGIVKMTTGCLTENRGSERVMQKLRMIREAEFIKHVWHDGRFRDRAEYRLLKEEWEAGYNQYPIGGVQ